MALRCRARRQGRDAVGVGVSTRAAGRIATCAETNPIDLRPLILLGQHPGKWNVVGRACVLSETPCVSPVPIASGSRMLTAAEFHRLADVPSEVEWFANITNPSTRRAYRAAVGDFTRFAGIARPEEFRIVTRAHVIAWRDELVRRGLGGSTIRHRMASLASLFEHLCDSNAITHDPVKGVERPKAETAEGKTPAIGDHQARALLAAPERDTVKSKRDRAILSMLLLHALRREELCKLKVRDVRHARKGVPHLRVSGKGPFGVGSSTSEPAQQDGGGSGVKERLG